MTLRRIRPPSRNAAGLLAAGPGRVVGLLVAASMLSGCAVVTVAGAVAGAAITVGGAVVSTGVKLTGKVIEKTIDVVTPSSDAPAKK